MGGELSNKRKPHHLPGEQAMSGTRQRGIGLPSSQQMET
jgi:hypothetical protein